MKQVFALLLCLVMCLPMIPAAAAEDVGDPEAVEIVESGAPEGTNDETEPVGAGAIDVPEEPPADVVAPAAAAEAAETGDAGPEAVSNELIASGDCGEFYWDPSTGAQKRYAVTWTLTSDGVLTVSGTGSMGWDGDCPWANYRTNITSLVIKSGVTEIGGFSQCSRLKSVTIPATVTEIYWGAFSGCSALKSVALPSGITAIPSFCFQDCSSLTSVTIPSGVTEIRASAFSGCSALASLTLPSNLRTIGEGAFYGCSALTAVTIPAGVTEIGNGAFAFCGALTAISVSSDNRSFSSSNGVLFNKNKSALIAYPGGRSGNYTIPSSVYVLSPRAFEGCQKLGQLTVGSNVTVIPERCFHQAAMTGIIFPSALEAVGDNAFYQCAGLTEITFPASVDSIGGWAFAHCRDLRTINFLGDAPSFGEHALADVGEYSNPEYYLPDSRPALVFYPAGAAGWDKVVGNTDIYYEYYIVWIPCEKPAVTAQPTSRTVFPGETAYFTVQSNTSVKYQWYYRTSKDGAWNKCSGEWAETPNLEITAKPYQEGYQYRCKMTNCFGSVYSYYATLHVSKPRITTQPETVAAIPGSNVTFRVFSDGATSFQWYYRKDADSAWNKCSGGSWIKDGDYYWGDDAYWAKHNLGSELPVQAKAYRNGYQYRCALTNDAGTTYSAVVTLNLKPGITSQPQSVTVYPNTTVVFSVSADCAESYQWQYRKDSGSSWSSCSGGTSATLSVEAKGYRSGYQYRCKVTNGNGSVYSASATLTVNLPKITGQPSTRYVFAGETVLFTVEAEGAAAYQWQYRKDSDSDWSNCSGGTSATLSIEAKAYRSGYWYRCKVSNDAGSVYSDTAHVWIKPGITSQPQSVTVYADTTVTFTVKADGATGYQWQYRSSDSAAWSSCSGGTSATLSVEAKGYRNGYQYRCVVSNSVGSAYSDAATLTVNRPVITAQPQSVTVDADTVVTFTVQAEGATSYQWQYRSPNSDGWSNCSGATSSTLSVEAKGYRSGYQYRCRVSNGAGSVYSNYATLWLSKPLITSQPQDVTADADTTVTFSVAAERATSYQWQWYNPSESYEWNNCSGGTSATLSVEAEAYRSGYRYRCLVSNAAGSVYSNYATLRVKLEITAQPQSVTAYVDTTVTFTVKAKGATSYQWQRLDDDGEWYSVGYSSATLSVHAFEKADGRQYRCRVSNGAGSVYSDIVTLTVITDPITSQPQDVTAYEGSVATFTVNAKGATSYQWQWLVPDGWVWNNCSGGTSATLSVDAKAYRNGYQYRCMVSNGSSSVYSDAATLWVLGKPTITSQPQSVTAYADTVVSFTVTADDATDYQWQYRSSESAEWGNCSGATSSTLSVEAKGYRSGYQYRCKVSNGAGSVYSDAATLWANMPKITTQPRSVTVYEGYDATFTVATMGATSYQWQFRSSSYAEWSNCSGGTSATLSVEALAYRNGYQYRCKVSNSAGTVISDAVTLRVR